MRGNPVPVGQRLYFWPEYAAVARAVRYETLLYDDAKPYFEELERRFGQAKVQAAVVDVCQVNRGGTPVTVHLKPEVRKQCFSLLGPAPEQEDDFYRHPDGTPRERPVRKLPDALAFKNETLAVAGKREAAAPPQPPPGRPLSRSAYNEVADIVGRGTAGFAAAAPPDTSPADLRALKRKYRTLVSAFRMTAADSPARVPIKADIQALRRQIHDAAGGTVL